MGSEEKEDWPSPFATAMKIIRDRETNIKHQQQISSSERSKIGQFGLLWVPKKDQRCRSRKLAVPSLQDLCMTILVKNADVITSLDSVPDVLRHKICQSLCDSRKMTNQFFELLARGSPTEIRIRDCSWLDEENFTQTFEGCDTSNLAVLQLDQCGRCMLDYILLATLARCPNNLPVLTALSLDGACRLSDAGLKAIISAAPCLSSMNLSECRSTNNLKLKPLIDEISKMCSQINCEITHCLREGNHVADVLAKQAAKLRSTEIFLNWRHIPKEAAGYYHMDRWQLPSIRLQYDKANFTSPDCWWNVPQSFLV